MEPLLRKPANGGPSPIDRREILNAILYVNRTGCPLEGIAPRFPQLENGLHRLLALAKSWGVEKIHDALREQVR